MTGTANTNRIHTFRTLAMPAAPPALPDCRTVLEWGTDGAPALRWETLGERDARLHKEWYEERMRKLGHRAFAPKERR